MKLDVFMDSGVDKFHTNHFLRGAVEACQSDCCVDVVGPKWLI